MTSSRQPKGIPAGGQFAATHHTEADLTLDEQHEHDEWRAEFLRPLTLQDVRWLRDKHGAYDPGARYFQHMGKVFEAAEEKAAATPAGRRMLAQEAASEELSSDMGIPAQQVREFYGEVESLEPGSEGHENVVQLWSQHIWNVPRGQVTSIDAKMRAATGEPTRQELVERRWELNAQIGTLDVNAAAAGIRKRFPDAHGVAACLAPGQVLDPGAMNVRVTDVSGNPVWEGSREDLPELGSLSLMPDRYQEPESPLRTAAIPHYNHGWRHYSLDKMAALTPEVLLYDV